MTHLTARKKKSTAASQGVRKTTVNTQRISQSASKKAHHAAGRPIGHAVILCAGKSTRTVPLTLTRPKPLLWAGNTTLIEHLLTQVLGLVEEVILVIGYKQTMIKEHIGERWNGLRIRYVIQNSQEGTGHALALCRKNVSGRFYVLNSDDLYFQEDLKELGKHENALLVKASETPERFGQVICEGGCLKRIAEKSAVVQSGIVNTGAYVLTDAVFLILEGLSKSPRGEYELTDALNVLAQKSAVQVVEAGTWVPVSYAWDLLAANEALLGRITASSVSGMIEKNVTVHGHLVIGEGSVIRSGSYIIGPVAIGRNCTIGPNAIIRGATSIGDRCRVGPAEIKNSIFFPHVRCDHVSYIGDSVLGEGAHIGAQTVTANLRHDSASIKSMVDGELVDTGRRKLGVILGDYVDTGIHTSFYPGRKMWPKTGTAPGEIVKKDIVS
ncbi:glucose-1-phosphate thymidylyltransferase [Candidatus Woesearchaeota archaeon CG_4_10_14_0_8_um_filter_47_5]|nr:MAG: glucose-1-phosphate thymidylyltransferase [Candidatus Woesearchaeota archaeon CG_4_10_14_0_8_um_filter_47_5]